MYLVLHSDGELSRELLQEKLHSRKNAAVVFDIFNLVSLTEHVKGVGQIAQTVASAHVQYKKGWA